jgi:hypothetical protein
MEATATWCCPKQKKEKAMNEITKVCDLSAKPSGELSDSDLEQVAGGVTIKLPPNGGLGATGDGGSAPGGGGPGYIWGNGDPKLPD